MLFTDASFFVFLGVVLAVYYLPFLNGRLQVAWLLLASLFFYAYNDPSLLVLLIVSAGITVLSSQRVASAQSLRSKRIWAAAGVILNLGVLAFFKYAGFLYSTLLGSQSAGAWLLGIPLPIGISFYTFHGVSLVIDVFRMGPAATTPVREGRNASYAERSLLYLTFFPQLIAGPIVKARDFFPQIHRHTIGGIDWTEACRILVAGYFLKSVVADNLAEQTFWLQYPYFLPFSSLNLLALLFGYSMQIFADFAGYSLIAIGLGKLFGYTLPTNFNFPYIAESFSEFWTRWHISLSSWLRDYLYIPLGGNRKGPARTYLNLMLVMFLGGLWHGAAWSYAIWGLWHGIALAVERVFRKSAFYMSTGIVIRILRAAVVFGFVSFAWLLFKLPDFQHVLTFLTCLRTNLHAPTTFGGPMIILLYGSAVVAYHAGYLVRRAQGDTALVALQPLRPVMYGAMLVMIALNSGPSAAFIYFQF